MVEPDESNDVPDDYSLDAEIIDMDDCVQIESDEDVPLEEDGDVELECIEQFTPPRDDASFILADHKESVFCVAIDPTGKYLASGGQDHVAIVWDLETAAAVFTTTGHEDSVTCVAFNKTGCYLATGDMAGGIHVWMKPPTDSPWTLIHSDSVGDLHWLIWWEPAQQMESKAATAVLAAGDADGLLSIWPINPSQTTSDRKRVKYIAGSGLAALAASYHLQSIDTDRPKLWVLYQNAELRLWDLKTNELLTTLQLSPTISRSTESDQLKDEANTVFCLACPQLKPVYPAARDRDLIVVGGLGSVHMIVCKQITDSTTSSFTARSIATIATGDDASVEAIDFSWTHPYFAFGTVNGMIGIVDTVTLRIRQKWIYTDENSAGIGLTRLIWSRTMPVFFTSTTHGAVVAWAGLSGAMESGDCGGPTKAPNPLTVWWGHRAMVLDFAVSPKTAPGEQFIASASDDSTVRIFAIDSSSFQG